MKTAARSGGRFALNSAIILRVIAVAVTAIIIEPVGIVIDVVVIILVRGLIEQAGARTGIVVRALSGRTDVIDPGVFGKVAAGLIAQRSAVFNPAAKSGGVAKTLMMATHHRTDAAEQQRPADHAGRRRRRGSKERTATATHRGLRRAVGLAGRSAILSG